MSDAWPDDGHGPPVHLRPAGDADADELVGLVAACWSEYPGCILDVESESPELLCVASSYAAGDGRFWVAEDGGQVVGCVGTRPADPGSLWLERLYVARQVRRRGVGGQLLGLVEAEARRRRATQVELWSDTRFTTAHRFYERRGYQRSPGARQLDDLSHSVEYHFRRALDGQDLGSAPP